MWNESEFSILHLFEQYLMKRRNRFDFSNRLIFVSFSTFGKLPKAVFRINLKGIHRRSRS
jgi:hypothetical protein